MMDNLSTMLMSKIGHAFEGDIGFAFTDGKDTIKVFRFFYHKDKDYELNLEHTFTHETFDEDWKKVENELIAWRNSIKGN